MLKSKPHLMALIVIAVVTLPFELGVIYSPQLSDSFIATSTSGPINPFDPPSYGISNAIAGYKVLAVLTPENTACLEANTRRLVLQTTEPSVEAFLSHSDPDAIYKALEQLGLTKSTSITWDWQFVSSDVGAQEVVEHITKKWNLSFVDTFCPKAIPVHTGSDGTELKTASPSPGWGNIENIDAGSYTDDNGQQVTLVAPTVGPNQTNYSLFLNNVKSNTGYFMQNGFIFLKNTACSPVWADTGTGMYLQPYAGMSSCPAGRTFTVTISRSGVWNYCIRDNTTGTYICQQRSQATGTHMILNLNTSVWVENYNTNSNWYVGFSSPLRAYDAYLFRNGSPQAWSSQHRHTVDACSSSWPVGNAILGSLVNRGTAYYYLSGTPRQC